MMRVPQSGQRRPPASSGRAHDGHATMLASASPIAMAGRAPLRVLVRRARSGSASMVMVLPVAARGRRVVEASVRPTAGRSQRDEGPGRGSTRPPVDTAGMRLELTRRGDYAVRAMLALTAADDDGWTSAPRIAASMAIPERFLPRVLRDLARAGLVDAHAGRSGGYRLARPATDQPARRHRRGRTARRRAALRPARDPLRHGWPVPGPRRLRRGPARASRAAGRGDPRLARRHPTEPDTGREVPTKTGRMAPIRETPSATDIQVLDWYLFSRRHRRFQPCVASFPFSSSRSSSSRAAPGARSRAGPMRRPRSRRRPRPRLRRRQPSRPPRPQPRRDHRHRGVRPRVHAGPADRRRPRPVHGRADQHRPAPHDITFPDGTTGRCRPGETASVEVDVPAGGLAFICSIPGHEQGGMTGTIGVTGGAAAGREPSAASHDDHGGPAPDTGVAADPERPGARRPRCQPRRRASRARSTTSTWS